MVADNTPRYPTNADDQRTEASDDISSVWYSIHKLAFGALDNATLVSASNGLPVNIVAGSSSGTEYTEDAAAAANPAAGAVMLVRADTPATITDADGDNVAQRGTNYGAAYTQIVDSSGNFVDSFGGGTQYTEGATDASITGTAMLMEGAADTLVAAQGTAADGLLVNLGSNNDVTVTGSVTANAGTNLNTSALLTTAAHDAAFGTAGTADAQVRSIQGIAGMTAVVVDGSAVTQPVSGTVTETNSAAILADTAAMDTNLATIAGDTTSLDAKDLMLGTDFSNVFGTVALTDGSNHVQVDIAADSVGIGGGTQYTEDDAAAANPVGTQPVLVRADTPATVTSLDGDVIAQRATNYGAAYVQVVDSSGNFINTFGGSGGTSEADDADFVAGTTQGTPAMGVYESSPTSVTDGDLGTVGITSTRSLKVEETNSTAILADTANMDTNLGTIAGAVAAGQMQVDIVADGAGLLTTAAHDAAFGTAGVADAQVRTVQGIASMTPLLVDATGQGDVPITLAGETVTVNSHDVTNAGTFAVQISDTSFAVADGNALGEGVLIQGDDGTDRKNINVDATTGDVQVDVTNTVTVASHDVTNAGTFAVQAAQSGTWNVGTVTAVTDITNTIDSTISGAALTALQLIDNPIQVLGTDTYLEGTDSAMLAGVVRNDTLAALANTDNEIAPLQVSALGGLWVHNHALNSGGAKWFSSNDIDETEEDVATGPCTVYSMYFWNSTAAPLYAQIFNTNTVTVGTTAPDLNFIIPANADSDGAGVVIPIPACGLEFTTALTVAVTTGVGTNAGAPGANAAGCIISYED